MLFLFHCFNWKRVDKKLTLKRVACDERGETFAVRKLYETTILINLRVDGPIRSHRLIESIFRVHVLIHIITLTFVERPRIISPNSTELSYNESITCEDVAKPEPDVS